MLWIVVRGEDDHIVPRILKTNCSIDDEPFCSTWGIREAIESRYQFLCPRSSNHRAEETCCRITHQFQGLDEWCQYAACDRNFVPVPWFVTVREWTRLVELTVIVVFIVLPIQLVSWNGWLNLLRIGHYGWTTITCIRFAPQSISKLYSLQHLDLTSHRDFQLLPELLASLTVLKITCQNRTLPQLSHPIHLKEFIFQRTPLIKLCGA